MAALLHDVIEDTPITKDQLASQFGQAVAELVYGVSKLDKLKFRDHKEERRSDCQAYGAGGFGNVALP
jgi:guanosine-3',5'-bis(diphosphate) 3'-pyrophosphohydrolase